MSASFCLSEDVFLRTLHLLIPIVIGRRPVCSEQDTHIRLLQLLQLDFPQAAVLGDQKFNSSLKGKSFIIRTEVPKERPTA